MRKTYNLIDSLVAIVQTVCAVGLISTLVGCGSPSETTRDPHTTSSNVTYYYDAEANICYGAVHNQSSSAFGVPCNEQVMAIANNAPTTQREIARCDFQLY